jgi:phosphoribosylanthranilate isomerase
MTSESLRVKICGLREPDNIREVCNLTPDYIGFVLTSLSLRVANLDSLEQAIKDGVVPPSVKKIGVFVNPTIEEVVEATERLQLEGVQLHGEESLRFCDKLRTLQSEVLLFKAIGIASEKDFENVEAYSPLVDAFLFDSKSSERGGTGRVFDWSLLHGYSGIKPFFLAGGIGPETIDDACRVCRDLGGYGVDSSSLCEVSPGKKDIIKVRRVIEEVRRA